EALACGTPVVAFRKGSVPEVMDHGVTGFVVDDVDGAVAAVGRVSELSRRRCREVFEARFSVERMTRDYLRVYRRLAERRPRLAAPRAQAVQRVAAAVDGPAAGHGGIFLPAPRRGLADGGARRDRAGG